MSEGWLPEAIAEELNDYLRSHAAGISGPVFAVSLWSYPDYAELGVSIGREELFDPADRKLSAEAMAAPSSLRWNSGDWDHCAERFVSDRTQQHLDPFMAAIERACEAIERHPSAVSWDELHRALRRWHVLSNDVMALVRPLDLLPCSPDAIAWVEFQSYSKRVEHAISMTRTNDAALLGRLFPHWRRLCDALDATDPDTLIRLREFRETQPLQGIQQRYRDAPILTSELDQLLSDCGFSWWDLAGWDGARVPSDFDPELPNYGTDETVALAFVVAHRIG